MDSSSLSSVSSTRNFTGASTPQWRTDSQPAVSHAPTPAPSLYDRAVRASSQSVGVEQSDQHVHLEMAQQLQQKSEVYASQLNSDHLDRSVDEKRRLETAPKRSPASYSLASYTGERANRSYLNMAGQKSGTVFDEIV